MNSRNIRRAVALAVAGLSVYRFAKNPSAPAAIAALVAVAAII
jgi:hypothetical protein